MTTAVDDAYAQWQAETDEADNLQAILFVAFKAGYDKGMAEGIEFGMADLSPDRRTT